MPGLISNDGSREWRRFGPFGDPHGFRVTRVALVSRALHAEEDCKHARCRVGIRLFILRARFVAAAKYTVRILSRRVGNAGSL